MDCERLDDIFPPIVDEDAPMDMNFAYAPQPPPPQPLPPKPAPIQVRIDRAPVGNGPYPYKPVVPTPLAPPVPSRLSRAVGAVRAWLHWFWSFFVRAWALCTRYFTNMREAYGMWKMRERSARLDAQRRARMWRVLCGLGTVVLALMLGATWTADEAGYVHEQMLPTYARHGQPGVDFSAPSTELTCTELRTSAHELAQLRAYAQHLLLDADTSDTQQCICAPMFGTRRRYIAVRIDVPPAAPTLLHLYNPVLNTQWTGVVDAERSLNLTRTYVRESQRVLFPARSDIVENLRADAVQLHYQSRTCTPGSVILQHEYAWCAQVCLDLLDGRSIYVRGSAPLTP